MKDRTPLQEMFCKVTSLCQSRRTKLHLAAPRVPREHTVGAKNNHPSNRQAPKVGLSLFLTHSGGQSPISVHQNTTGGSYSYFPGSNGRVQLEQVRLRGHVNYKTTEIKQTLLVNSVWGFQILHTAVLQI